MRIQLLSDLHLEVHPHWVPTPAPGADLLVLAGDIGSYQPGSRIDGADFGLQKFSPFPSAVGPCWPTPVLFIPGNHEYDMLDFDATHARLQASCARLGITWLDRQILHAADIPSLNATAAAEKVRFIGTTLWSDFDALAPQNAASPTALADLLKARKKAFSAANWYLKQTRTTRFDAPMLADQVRDEALACFEWLRGALAQPFHSGRLASNPADLTNAKPTSGKTVVVTHFAPSLKSADPRYGLTPGTAGFCNSLDDLLPHADLWLHGHLHCASDYRAGRCHVVANPLGYVRKNEQRTFQERLVIEV